MDVIEYIRNFFLNAKNENFSVTERKMNST